MISASFSSIVASTACAGRPRAQPGHKGSGSGEEGGTEGRERGGAGRPQTTDGSPPAGGQREGSPLYTRIAPWRRKEETHRCARKAMQAEHMVRAARAQRQHTVARGWSTGGRSSRGSPPSVGCGRASPSGWAQRRGGWALPVHVAPHIAQSVQCAACSVQKANLAPWQGQAPPLSRMAVLTCGGSRHAALAPPPPTHTHNVRRRSWEAPSCLPACLDIPRSTSAFRGAGGGVRGWKATKPDALNLNPRAAAHLACALLHGRLSHHVQLHALEAEDLARRPAAEAVGPV